MLSTTVLFFFAARRLWEWSVWRAGLTCGLFFVVEAAFFAANSLKVVNGGWVPLAIGAVIFVLMETWKTGRGLVWDKLRPASMPLEMFLDEIERNTRLPRVPGIALFMTANPEGTPIALLHNLKHNKVLHEQNLILTIVTHEVPQMNTARRLEVERLGSGFHRIIGNYGFMEEPNVPELLALVALDGKRMNMHKTTYFLSRETIVPGRCLAMAQWRQWIFSVLSRNAQSAGSFYRIPANRVVELGMQVEL
jgi:KUP system potassium uptake protein